MGVMFPGVPSARNDVERSYDGRRRKFWKTGARLWGAKPVYRGTLRLTCQIKGALLTQYPNGAELNTIEKEYAQALFDKDMAFLIGSFCSPNTIQGARI